MLIKIERCFCSICFYEGPIEPMAVVPAQSDDTFYIEHRCPACNSLIGKYNSVTLTGTIDGRWGIFTGVNRVEKR